MPDANPPSLQHALAAQAAHDEGRLPLAVLIAVNLIPAVGVLWLGWDAMQLLIVYWMENLVVGGYTVLRMLSAGGWRSLPLVAFFLLHFGGFCAGHGAVLTTFFTGSRQLDNALLGNDWPGPLSLLQGFLKLTHYLYVQAPDYFFWAVLGMVISHGISFYRNHVVRQEDRGRSVGKIMHSPYGRIIAMHFAVLLGGILSVKFGATAMALLVLVALKIGLDVILHVRSHRPRTSSHNGHEAQPLRQPFRADP
jgi:hypothetical protein